MSDINLNLGQLVGKAYYPLFSSKNRYIAIKGSRGSGKSQAIFTKIIFDILTKPWCNYLIVRRYSNTHRKSTFSTFEQVSERMHVHDLFNFNSSLPEITYLPTGQKIFFVGADKPESVTSITAPVGGLTHMLVEEAYQMESEESFDKINDSLRGKVSGYPEAFYQTIVIFNPWSESTWLKGRFFDEDTREKDLLSYTTTFEDNPFLDDDFVKRMEDLKVKNPKKAQVVAYGNWGISEGLIYENVRQGHKPYDRQLPLVVGLDFGFTNDPTALVKAYIDQEDSKIYVDKESYRKGQTNQDVAQTIKDLNLDRKTVIADSAEPKSIAELKRAGIGKVKPAFKGKDSINFGIDILQGYEIVVSPECPNVWKEISMYVWDTQKNGQLTNKPVDANNHAMDALRYACVNYLVRNGGRGMSYEDRRKLMN